MLARKEKVVAQNNDGILYLFKKNKIAFFHGLGSFTAAAQTVGGSSGSRDKARRARGNARDRRHRLEAAALPGVPFDNPAGARQCRSARHRLPLPETARRRSAPG